MKKLPVLICGAALLSSVPAAHSFSGEDPAFGNPWHHNEMSAKAARSSGWSSGAASSMAWANDYLDSYLYNPVWWGQGGLDRYKMSKALANEMKKLHFDDLFTTPQINLMWRRYTTHTLAALLWAKEKNDVAAAQHIVGVSLHALQDFYSHSNWIDAPDRRKQTYFECPPARRTSVGLYSGAYEHPEHMGQKSHGIWRYDAAIYNATGVKQIMEVACTAISPFSNSPECQDYKRALKGSSVRPTVSGVKLPQGVWWYSPPGIALDNAWSADLGVQQRGLRDINGQQAFKAAYDLAERQSAQWLKTLERVMNKTGNANFWTRVTSTAVPQSQREKQYEDYGLMPFQMVSAGNYPPRADQANRREVYLRLLLNTANESMAGTDADIELRAAGKKFLLDYSPRTNFVTAYNDFEQGDRDAYIVGPFDDIPTQIELFNNAPNAGQVVGALYKDFKSALSTAWKGAGDLVLGLVAGHADRVASAQKVWEVAELQNLRSSNFVLNLNGGSEGNYQVDGVIRKTDETPTHHTFQIELTRLRCIQESKWDRGSNSDEPFTLFALVPLPGAVHSHMAGPYSDVDSGESRDIKRLFIVTLPKGHGMLTLSAQQWESDDESSNSRNKMLASFAGQLDNATKKQRQSFAGALGSSVAADWKLGDIEVYAWENASPPRPTTSANDTTPRAGFVLNQRANRWINGGKGSTFTLNLAGFKPTGIKTPELLTATHIEQLIPIPGGLRDKIAVPIENFQKNNQSTEEKETPNRKPKPDIKRIPDAKIQPIPDIKRIPEVKKLPEIKKLPDIKRLPQRVRPQ
jgi:hypothetical protein